MQSAIWKIAALLTVIGIGSFVVLEVHKRLPPQTAGTAGSEQFKRLDETAGESEAQVNPANPIAGDTGRTDDTLADSASQESAPSPFGQWEPDPLSPPGTSADAEAGTDVSGSAVDPFGSSDPAVAASQPARLPSAAGQEPPPQSGEEPGDPFGTGSVAAAASPTDPTDPFAGESSGQGANSEQPADGSDSAPGPFGAVDPMNGEKPLAAAAPESSATADASPPAAGSPSLGALVLSPPGQESAEGDATGAGGSNAPTDTSVVPAGADGKAGDAQALSAEMPAPGASPAASDPFSGAAVMPENPDEGQPSQPRPLELAGAEPQPLSASQTADNPFAAGDTDSDVVTDEGAESVEPPSLRAPGEFEADAESSPAGAVAELQPAEANAESQPANEGLAESVPASPFDAVNEEAAPAASSESPDHASADEPAVLPQFASDPFGGPAPALGEQPQVANEPEPAVAEPDAPASVRLRSLADEPPAAGNPAEPGAETGSGGIQIIPNPGVSPEPAEGPRPEFVGDATLDGTTPPGPQQPQLTIQKIAPAEATVGEPLVYAIRVRNIGQSPAHDVIVEDRIPRGTTLEGSIPQAELVEKRLIWHLGQIDPGQEKSIRIKVIPTAPGEIGSVATVRFVAEVAATTRITSPELSLNVTGPGEVAVGEPAVFHFHLANTGEGEAHNVYIRNLLPAGLEHPGGQDIEYEVGTLKPGESREIDLAVTAAQEGAHELKAFLNTGTTTRSEAQASVQVIRSRLLIQRQGPKRRFLGRPAEYTTTVTNRSSSRLERITVVEQLPEGLELAAVPASGHFDPQRRTITWRIDALDAGVSTTLKTSVIAREIGVLQGIVRAMDVSGNRAELASQLEVTGFASLSVDLEHDGRPVGVGEQVALRLTVRNRGTGAAEAVQAQFEIPEHLEFVNAEGPGEFEQDGRTIRFATIDQLAADGEQSFDIVLTAAEPGTTRVSALLTAAELEVPLREDEAVVVEPASP